MLLTARSIHGQIVCLPNLGEGGEAPLATERQPTINNDKDQIYTPNTVIIV